jgi:hypothetical protein
LILVVRELFWLNAWSGLLVPESSNLSDVGRGEPPRDRAFCRQAHTHSIGPARTQGCGHSERRERHHQPAGRRQLSEPARDSGEWRRAQQDKLTKCDNPAIEDGGLLQPVSAPHLTALTRLLELFKPDWEFVGDPIIRVRLVLEPGNLFESPIIPGGAYCPGLRLAMRGMSDLKRWKRVLHVLLTTAWSRCSCHACVRFSTSLAARRPDTTAPSMVARYSCFV